MSGSGVAPRPGSWLTVTKGGLPWPLHKLRVESRLESPPHHPSPPSPPHRVPLAAAAAGPHRHFTPLASPASPPLHPLSPTGGRAGAEGATPLPAVRQRVDGPARGRACPPTLPVEPSVRGGGRSSRPRARRRGAAIARAASAPTPVACSRKIKAGGLARRHIGTPPSFPLPLCARWWPLTPAPAPRHHVRRAAACAAAAPPPAAPAEIIGPV